MKSRNLKLLSILCIILIIFAVTFLCGIAAKKEKTQEWISATTGGEISLEDITISFEPGVLEKDVKIHILYFGEGEYQLGPEIKVNGTFMIYFADAPAGESVVITFKDGEWVELKCIDGYVETDHFSRYR